MSIFFSLIFHLNVSQILTFIHCEKRGKQLQLYRGVHPILSPKTFSFVQNSDRLKTVRRYRT